MEEGALKVVTRSTTRRGQGRHHDQRSHPRDRWRGRAGPVAQPGRREDARLINTNVKLKIERPGRKDALEFTLTRSNIVVPAVRSRQEADVGYIRITTFSEQTFDGMKKAIEKLTADIGADKVKGFIIDLRNNRGGRLDQAVMVSDGLLERGEIVSTRGRNPEETTRFKPRSDLTKGKPVSC